MEIDNTLKKILYNNSKEDENWISFEMKLEIIKDLVSEEIANTLKKQIIISKTINEKANFTLPDKEYENSHNIRKFLKILWAKNIKITGWEDYSTDYTWWRDYYTLPTIVRFNIPESKIENYPSGYDCFEYKM